MDIPSLNLAKLFKERAPPGCFTFLQYVFLSLIRLRKRKLCEVTTKKKKTGRVEREEMYKFDVSLRPCD